MGNPLQTSDPLKDLAGFNPEQLFGLSWATCLNATIEALLKARKPGEKQSESMSISAGKKTEKAFISI